jgi:hypothetical protein
MVLGPGLVILPGVRCGNRLLPAATSRWLIVFAPEGSPLGRYVTLNCGIRDYDSCLQLEPNVGQVQGSIQ